MCVASHCCFSTRLSGSSFRYSRLFDLFVCNSAKSRKKRGLTRVFLFVFFSGPKEMLWMKILRVERWCSEASRDFTIFYKAQTALIRQPSNSGELKRDRQTARERQIRDVRLAGTRTAHDSHQEDKRRFQRESCQKTGESSVCCQSRAHRWKLHRGEVVNECLDNYSAKDKQTSTISRVYRI